MAVSITSTLQTIANVGVPESFQVCTTTDGHAGEQVTATGAFGYTLQLIILVSGQVLASFSSTVFVFTFRARKDTI